MTALADLDFSDLAVEENPSACRYKRFSREMRLFSVSEEHWAELHALWQALSEKSGSGARFRLLFGGMHLRVQRRDTPDGIVFVVRRIARNVRQLVELGLPEPLVRTLLSSDLRAGLLLFAGGPGAGKTTAACALLVDRLKLFGGFTWTAENPAEYELQGAHGAGQCYQEEVSEDAEIRRVLMDTLRSGADTFFIGEIREEQAAKAACLAAASGMLVISTIHADDPRQAILKMGLLSGFDALAQSLQGVVTLRMDRELSAQSGSQKALRVQSFLVEDEAARGKIREGNFATLNQDIEAQRIRSLTMGGQRLAPFPKAGR